VQTLATVSTPLAVSVPLAVTVTTWLKPLWLVLAGALVVLGLLAMASQLLRLAFPKIHAVARTTTKEALSQPLFWVLLSLGAGLIVLFPFVPYFTLGEDIKFVKECGLQLMMVLSIIMAVWTASVSVAEEIEGQIALTLLSKPIGRRQYIVGKFLGILGPVALMFLVLGPLFLGSVSFKVVYDAREMALPDPTWEACRDEVIQIAPGLALSFMEAVVLSSIGVALSTRLPLAPNLVICAAVYVLGHLMPTLVATAAKQFAIPYFIAQLLATILPSLENFNISTAVSMGKEVPLEYVAVAAVYCVVYTLLAMLLALLLFEDRDLG
jgi:ABC-type transport system involved in multi-copper enzyme maturation permease subunit